MGQAAVGRNWEEEREGKLYSDYIVGEKNLCLLKGRWGGGVELGVWNLEF